MYVQEFGGIIIVEEFCLSADDVELASNLIEDVALEIFDLEDSGFPVHKDWMFDADIMAHRYISIVYGLKELEKRIRNGNYRICWIEGEYGN